MCECQAGPKKRLFSELKAFVECGRLGLVYECIVGSRVTLVVLGSLTLGRYRAARTAFSLLAIGLAKATVGGEVELQKLSFLLEYTVALMSKFRPRSLR